jgi:hypothetical protein
MFIDAYEGVADHARQHQEQFAHPFLWDVERVGKETPGPYPAVQKRNSLRVGQSA